MPLRVPATNVTLMSSDLLRIHSSTDRRQQVAARPAVRPQHSQCSTADVRVPGTRQHRRPVRGSVQRHRRAAVAAEEERLEGERAATSQGVAARRVQDC
jgi:hypothetical protein